MDRQAGDRDGAADTARGATRGYRSLASTLGDGVFRLDDCGRFVDLDEGFAELIGQDCDDLLGRHASSVFAGEDADRFDDLVRNPDEADGGPTTITTGVPDDDRRAVDCHLEVVETGEGPELVGLVQEVDRGEENDRREYVDRGEDNDRSEGVDRGEDLAAELERYRTIVETIPDGAYVLDEDHRFVTVNGTFAEMTGYDRETLLGRNAEMVSTDAGHERGLELRRRLREGDLDVAELEEEIEPSDGEGFDAEIRFAPLRDDDGTFRGTAGVVRDITERKAYEQRLQALNHLNEVVRGVSDAVIAKSTRAEIETIACERLAAADAYGFAWIGESNPATGVVEPCAMAGVEGALDDVTISIDPEDEGAGPTGRALRTGEIQTAQDCRAEGADGPLRAVARECGVDAAAAVPISHEDTTFGVLNVYTARSDGFEAEERTVLDHLGELVGHAIAAVQRKQALMSDTVVELELGVPDVVDHLDADVDHMEIEEAVPIGDDAFLVYGRTESGLATVEALVEEFDSWEEVTAVDDDGDPVRFQVRLSEPPMLSAIANVGGSIEGAVVEDGDYRMTVHLPESADVRRVVDTVQDIYPQADALARRQVTVAAESAAQVTEAWLEELTDRQLTAIEVAYFSGFFEWPRGSSGQEVAESLGVSSPTFHQHVRRAERKLLDVVLSDAGSGRLSTE